MLRLGGRSSGAVVGGRILRAAGAADWRPIVRLIWAARLNLLGLDWRRFLVVEERGRVIGAVQVRPHADGTRELASLVVAPGARGGGVARLLIRRALAREDGVVHLRCASDLEPFYVRSGFERVPPAEIPAALLPSYRLVSVLATLARSPRRMIVMRRAAAGAP